MNALQLKTPIALGVILCVLAVIIGAFGAHALAEHLAITGRSDVYELANRYQFYHGLGILALSAISQQLGNTKAAFTASWLLFLGTLIFSGSLYALALTNIGALGAITPIGGSLLILGWGYFLMAVMNSKNRG